MDLTIGATGPATPEVAWQRYLRPARWHEWSPQISRVDYPGDEISPGGRGTVHGPLGVSIDFEILTVDRGAWSWTWRAQAPLRIVLVMDHAVIADGAGSRTVLVLTGPFPVIVGYAPLARIALGRLVSR